MINTLEDEYVILELIPTGINPEKGQLVQMSAIKLKGLKLVDRFDYRMNEDEINFKKIIELISYDKEAFKYASEDEIYNSFEKWIGDLPLLYINDSYTLNFIDRYKNKKESILEHLDLQYDINVIDTIITKYNLQPSNYIVDLLYEALIYNSNNK